MDAAYLWMRLIYGCGLYMDVYGKSRIKEVKEDEYSNSLTKILVCAMFCAGDI